MQFVKLHESILTPKRQSNFAAGFDLSSSINTIIPAYGKMLIPTGLKIATPIGTFGQITSRSGLASNHFIVTAAGVIDSGLFYLIINNYLF